MAEFSLGAAIGATGRFPRYTAPTPQKDEYAKEAQEELRNLRNRVSIDKKKYHRIYEDPVKDMTIDFYNKASQDILSREPGAMNNAFERYANWDAETNKYVARSESLKSIVELAERGGTVGKFVPRSVVMARNLINQAENEEDLLKKIQENPTIFNDKYVTVDPNTRMIAAIQQDVIPFDEQIRKNILTRDKAKILNFNRDTKGNIVSDERFYTIPANKTEAERMKATYKQIYNEDLGEIETAEDLGLKYFVGTPFVEQQYRALKYAEGDTNAIDKPLSEIYKDFYNEHILTNIPNYDKTKTTYFGPRTTVYVGGEMTTPTNYQIAREQPVNYRDARNTSKSAIMLSSAAQGTEVDYAMNADIIDRETLTQAYPTQSGTLKIKVSTIYMLPSAWDADQQVYTPITDQEVADLKAQNEKVMYLPWAAASGYPMTEFANLPGAGQANFWIPMYNRTVENGVTKMVINPSQRSGNNLQGSLILNALFAGQKLKQDERDKFMMVYREFMKDVIDSND